MRPLDRAVLVGQAAVVAGGRHAVMRAQRPIAFGQVLGRVPAQVAERGRQAVGAVLPRRAAEVPERPLQPLRQRREALAAQHHPGMGEARPGQPEVVQQVVQGPARDAHTESAHVREVREAPVAGLVRLAEDHLLPGAVRRPPGADPPLQGAPDAGVQLGVAAQQLLVHADRTEPRAALQHRHHLGLEQVAQRVRPAPAAPRPLPRREGGIAGQPVARGAAEARLRGRHVRGVRLLQHHEQPLLAS